jgi:hypothetical protein
MPQAPGNPLVSLCRELQQQHALRTKQQQRKRQQGRSQLQDDYESQLLYRLHIKPVWELCGASDHSWDTFRIKEFILERMQHWEVPEYLHKGW